MGENSIIIDQLVWAKLRFCPYWPARVVVPPQELGKSPGNKLCVLFFGSKNYGFVARENVVDYIENKKKYLKKCGKKDFVDAVTKMEEFISDPGAFASNGMDRQISDEIIVKKECNAIVKSEKTFDEIPYQTELVQRFGSKAHIATLQKEKENIIQELLTVKKSNQCLLLQRQQNGKEILNLNRLVSENEKKYFVKVQDLTAEIQNLKQRIEVSELDKIEKLSEIGSLKKEQKLLLAQIKQLKMGKRSAEKLTDKRKSNESTSNSDGEFEVDSIQSHRMKTKQREFYVRWKGYSQENDSWVQEKYLNCPIILKKYLKEHNLK